MMPALSAMQKTAARPFNRFGVMFFLKCYGNHRDLHVRLHSFPTRRSSDLFGSARASVAAAVEGQRALALYRWRSEEHTSELQSQSHISYAVFCLKNKKT